MLEKMIYETVINYDQFGAAQNGVVSLFGFGLSRRNWEINFLRFLPADKRHAIYDSWYQKSYPELILPLEQQAEAQSRGAVWWAVAGRDCRRHQGVCDGQ